MHLKRKELTQWWNNCKV